jgi:putative spermidine/putrescine transport system permease protein
MSKQRATSGSGAVENLRINGGRLLLRIVIWLAYIFLLAPVVVIIPIAFSSGTFLSYPLPGFSLRWFESLFVEYPWLLALKNSFIVAIATTFLATVLGTLAAYGLDRMKWRYKPVLTGLLVAPMIVPSVIVALAIYFFFARIGIIGSLLGVILAHTVIAVPLVVVTVAATLKGFDHNLVRAASSLGAPPVTVFLTVVLPMILPGVMAGAIFAFITSFDEVVIALFLTGPQQITLPRQLFSGLRNQLDPSIVAVAVLMMVVTVLMLGILEYIQRVTARRGGGVLGSSPGGS